MPGSDDSFEGSDGTDDLLMGPSSEATEDLEDDDEEALTEIRERRDLLKQKSLAILRAATRSPSVPCAPASRPRTRTHTVLIRDFDFVPRIVDLSPGDRVEFALSQDTLPLAEHVIEGRDEKHVLFTSPLLQVQRRPITAARCTN